MSNLSNVMKITVNVIEILEEDLKTHDYAPHFGPTLCSLDSQ